MTSQDPWRTRHSGLDAGERTEERAEAPHTAPTTQRYTHIATAGTGGMGEVDVVRDGWLNRQVARKTLNPDLPQHRLVHEAEITALLDHPNIVAVHDTGIDARGRRFYTMPLVRGATLRACLDDNLESRLRRVRSLLAAANAVAYAHSLGIVHRDLKPANLMLAGHDRTYVMDWGIAERAGSPGRREGTPGFSHPEQLDGATVSPQHDLYALGRCLLCVICGRADAPPPEAPVELVAIAQLATEGGYPSAEALVHDMEAWLDGRRVNAYQYSSSELLSRAVSTFRLPLGVGLASLVVIGIVGVVALQNMREERDRARAAEQASNEHLSELWAARAAASYADRSFPASEVYAATALSLAPTPLARGVLSAFHGSRASLKSTRPLPCPNPRLLASGRIACLDGDVATIGTVQLEHPGLNDVVEADGELITIGGPLSDLASVAFHDPTVFYNVPVSATTRHHAPFTAVHNTTARLVTRDGVSPSLTICPGHDSVVGGIVRRSASEAAWGCKGMARYGDPAGEVYSVDLHGDPASLAFTSAGVLVADFGGGLRHVVDGKTAWQLDVPGGTAHQLTVAGRWVLATSERGGAQLLDWTTQTWHAPLPLLDQGQTAVVDEALVTLGNREARYALPEAGLPHLTSLSDGVTAVRWTPDGGLWVAHGAAVTHLHPSGARTTYPQPDCHPVKDLELVDGRAVRICAGRYDVAWVDATPSEPGVRGGGRRLWWSDGSLWRATYGRVVQTIAADLTPGPLVRLPSATRDVAVIAGESWLLGEDAVLRRTTSAAGITLPGATAIASAPQGPDFLWTGTEALVRQRLDGDEAWRIELPSAGVSVDWSPTHDLAAVGLFNGSTVVVRASDGTIVAELPPNLERTSVVSFSPDGTLLATGSWDDSLRLWSTAALLTPPTLASVSARYDLSDGYGIEGSSSL